jgi:hypothetical protein
MDVRELMAQARDGMTVKQVFGDPVERNGVTVIPVAHMIGGAGGGAATPIDQAESGGTGGGFGIRASPAGLCHSGRECRLGAGARSQSGDSRWAARRGHARQGRPTVGGGGIREATKPYAR